MKIKVVMFSSLPPVISGISTHTLNLSRELSKIGVEVDIISFLNNQNEKSPKIGPKINAFGLNQYSYFDVAGLYSILKPSATKKAIEMLNDMKPDLAHFHHRTSSIEFSMEKIKKETKLNFVNTFHSSCGSLRFNIRDAIHYVHFKNFCKILKKTSDKIITVSEFNKNKLIENGLRNVSVISNGVNVSEFDSIGGERARNELGYKRSDIVILFVGRHSSEKGLHYLLLAFNKLSKKYSNIKLVTIGDGPLLSTYKFLFNNKRTLFLGKVDKKTLIKHYKASDIFVLPSTWPEPNPVVLFEAMASKLPIICFNVGGAPEVINNCKSGSIINVSVTQLEKELEKFINDEKLRSAYGKKGYKNVKKYTWKNIAKKVKAVYKSVLYSKT
ncbi:MAG: glycosyltransferase family 4 protein [Candidatus Aenigmarchaeota archaeon]|nr:glycosyltransferase family 4 protein [Candidatus Aenigmarchaeota archaeon]